MGIEAITLNVKITVSGKCARRLFHSEKLRELSHNFDQMQILYIYPIPSRLAYVKHVNIYTKDLVFFIHCVVSA